MDNQRKASEMKVGRLLLRAIVGGLFVGHGTQKLFGWFGGAGFEKFSQIFEQIGYHPGAFWTAVVGLTEIVGGLLLAVLDDPKA